MDRSSSELCIFHIIYPKILRLFMQKGLIRCKLMYHFFSRNQWLDSDMELDVSSFPCRLDQPLNAFLEHQICQIYLACNSILDKNKCIRKLA